MTETFEQYNKLVRDNIPDILDKGGIPYEKRIAENDEEFKQELFKKLDEEIDEFRKDRSVGELADILEVIYALRKLPEYENVLTVQDKKRGEKGGFDKRIIAKGEKPSNS